MCRFAAYLGPPITIEMLTTLPSHSIVKQSYHAKEREEPLNGDGFGIAWYAPELSDEPAAYRAVTPAWSDDNLLHLARVTRSGCVLAHVRAATPGLGVNLFNCHPFLGDGLAFMHNGYIASFAALKRALMADLSEPLWLSVRGTTDSEVLFAVFRQHWAATEGPSHARMVAALERMLNRLIVLSREHGVTEPHQLNLCVTDGRAMAATRLCTGAPDDANSLYLHQGARYICAGGVCEMVEPDEGGPAVLVASERLSDDPGWDRLPGGHVVMVTDNREVELRPLQLSA